MRNNRLEAIHLNMKIRILLATVYVATSSIDAGLFANLENEGLEKVVKEQILIIEIYDNRYISIFICSSICT